jgi:hypothetical protein
MRRRAGSPGLTGGPGNSGDAGAQSRPGTAGSCIVLPWLPRGRAGGSGRSRTGTCRSGKGCGSPACARPDMAFGRSRKRRGAARRRSAGNCAATGTRTAASTGRSPRTSWPCSGGPRFPLTYRDCRTVPLAPPSHASVPDPGESHRVRGNRGVFINVRPRRAASAAPPRRARRRGFHALPPSAGRLRMRRWHLRSRTRWPDTDPSPRQQLTVQPHQMHGFRNTTGAPATVKVIAT